MGLQKEGQALLDEAHEVLGHLKDADFEKFKEHMIALGEQLLAGQLMMLDVIANGKKEIQDVAVESIQAVRGQNDKDFKLAEKNFNKIRMELDELQDARQRAEVAMILVWLKVNSFLETLVKKDLITLSDADRVDNFKSIPKRILKFLSGFFGVTQKSIREGIREAVKAA